MILRRTRPRKSKRLKTSIRRNLNPIEEAIVIEGMMKKFGEAEAVASVLNKAVSYVVRAFSLVGLPASVKALIATGEITAAHWHQMARAPEKQRETLVKFVTTKNDYLKRYPTIQELRREMEKRIEKDLKKAPFPQSEEYAGEIACNVCPQNSANQGVLFDGAKDGICTGPACFKRKENFFYKEMVEDTDGQFGEAKSLGVVSEPGYGNTITGGYPILKMDGELKKRMKKKPAEFGWCVVKPGPYSEKKKPYVAVVSLTQKGSGHQGYDGPENQLERERLGLVRETLNEALSWRRN